MRAVLTVALAALGFTLACGNSSGPNSGLDILSGDHLSDTVGSILKPPLTVELLDNNHQPDSGQTVYVSSSAGPVLVAPIDDPGFVINRLPVITDASGQAAVWVEAKYSAGPGVITTDANGQSVRAYFTVLPGAPAIVRANPRDTVLYVGASVTFRPFVTDAYGDRRPDTPRLPIPVTQRGPYHKLAGQGYGSDDWSGIGGGQRLGVHRHRPSERRPDGSDCCSNRRGTIHLFC